MPELPEVETIARGLAKRVTGDVIESVWLGQKKEPLKSPAAEIASVLEHSRIAEVRRMGKHLVFDLDRVENAGVARALLPANGRGAKRKRKRPYPLCTQKRAGAPAPHLPARRNGSSTSA
jgi:hypothetical protein